MELSIVIASTQDGVIGAEPAECLYSTKDKEHFKMVTQYAPVHMPNLLIVGRKTWETLPEIMRTCKYRKYIVLTRQVDYRENKSLFVDCVEQSYKCDAIVAHTFDDVLKYCMDNRSSYYKIFVIGGAEIYKLALESGFVTEIYLTEFCVDLTSELGDAAGLVKMDNGLFNLK